MSSTGATILLVSPISSSSAACGPTVSSAACGPTVSSAACGPTVSSAACQPSQASLRSRAACSPATSV
jgi:hypothetical protein